MHPLYFDCAAQLTLEPGSLNWSLDMMLQPVRCKCAHSLTRTTGSVCGVLQRPSVPSKSMLSISGMHVPVIKKTTIGVYA